MRAYRDGKRIRKFDSPEERRRKANKRSREWNARNIEKRRASALASYHRRQQAKLAAK